MQSIFFFEGGEGVSFRNILNRKYTIKSFLRSFHKKINLSFQKMLRFKNESKMKIKLVNTQNLFLVSTESQLTDK